MKRLQAEINYTNPATGSIACGLTWVGDFEAREDKDQTWEEWGGNSLEETNDKELEEELISYLQDILGDALLEAEPDIDNQQIDKNVIACLVDRIEEETAEKFSNFNIKSYASSCLEMYNESFQGE